MCTTLFESPPRTRTLTRSRAGTENPIQNFLHEWLFPNAQQKGSRFQVGGLGVGSCREIRAERLSVRSVFASVRGVFARVRGQNCRETQNRRHFWTRVASSRLKSVNSHRDRGVRGREMQGYLP